MNCSKTSLLLTNDHSKAQTWSFLPSEQEENLFYIQSDARSSCDKDYLSANNCDGDHKIELASGKGANQLWSITKNSDGSFSL